MPIETLRSPHYWRFRARELRDLAASADDIGIKNAMLMVAAEFDSLSHRAAKWHAGNRVSRRNGDEFGTIIDAGEKIKVLWDGGRTSYFRRDRLANVKIAD